MLICGWHLDLFELEKNSFLTLNWTRLCSFYGELPTEESILREIGDLLKRIKQQAPAVD